MYVMILRFLFFVWAFCKALSTEKYRHYINIFIYLFIIIIIAAIIIIIIIIIIITIIIILVIKQIGQPRPVTITYYYYHVDITFLSLLKSRYNSEELKNFPLGTVMEMPKPPLPPAPYVPPQKQDSEESDGISLPVRCLFSPLKLIP